MCEGLERCPTTGKNIEEAPCRAIQRIMETCKTGIEGIANAQMIQTTTPEHGGISAEVFFTKAGWTNPQIFEEQIDTF